MSDALLTMKGISKDFELADGSAIRAVNDVSLTVEENSVCVLLGPSGCGKSTILRMMAGLEDPSAGDIMLKQHPVMGPARERGMVFQAYTSFDWLSVRKNVEFGMKINGVGARERKEKAEHFIKLVGLEKFIDAYPTQLSGGMRQRVAIARTLANGPELLLMDEPFGALDSQTRLQMQQLLLRIWEHKKKTVVFVTHDIDEAILLADRVFVMGSKPGHIRRILNVDIPHPRTLDLAMEPEFIALKREVMDLLHDDLNEIH